MSFDSLKLVLGIARDKVVIRFREWFGEQCVERNGPVIFLSRPLDQELKRCTK